MSSNSRDSRNSRASGTTSQLYGSTGCCKNSRRNGNGQISSPPLPGSKTSKWISMKLGIYHYIVCMTTHANPCGAAAMWVAHGWSRPICDLSHFSVLVYLFFVYFILQLALSLHQLILMINTSHNVFLHKEMPFGVAMRQLAPGVKSPKSPILGA